MDVISVENNVVCMYTYSVVIAIAMEAEAAPFIEHLSLEAQDDFFSDTTPFKAYQGKHESCNLTLITNGKDEVHGTGVDNVGTIPEAVVACLPRFRKIEF